MPVAATVKLSPAHRASLLFKSVPKVGAVGSESVTLKVDDPVQELELVMLKLLYVPDDNPVIVAVPETTEALKVPELCVTV